MKSSFHALGNSETRENYSSGFETIWVEIVNTKAKNVLCCCAYRHPSVSPVRFKEYLESTLSQLTSENKSIFIMGNFNINLLNCESHPESNDFLLMLNSFFFQPYILQPTRITERSATLTDNIFANTYAMNAISGNLVSKISDHLPQFLIVDNLKVNYKVLNYYKNDFSKFDEEKFINDFSLPLDWNNISSDYVDAKTKFDIFYDQISQFINSHVPLRKLSKRKIKLSTNNFFVNVGKNTDKDIPCGNCCPTSFLKGNFPDSMFLSPFTSVEVDSYISQMDNNKSTGPYSIPVPLLKILKTHISPLISSLIDDSFLCGIFPSKLKLAKLPQFLRKALGKTKMTIGQYQFYLFLVKFLKRLCLSTFIVILNLVTFFIHFNLALGKSARQIMH